MKKLSFLALAAVGLLFGACTDKDSVENGGGVLNDAGEGYIRVGLSIPSSVATRAWGESSQLDDGKTAEYGVTTAYLLLFEGNTESAAKLTQIVTLSSFDNKVGTTTDQVTVNSGDDFVAKIDEAPTKDLWALAVLNSTGVISPATSNGIIAINGTDVTTDVTISDLQAKLDMTVETTETYAGKLPFVNSTTGHIFMSNAVLFDKQGGTVDPGATFNGHILVKINKDYIYTSKAAAQAGLKAADIYVERGVAKVTVSGSGTNKDEVSVSVAEYDKTSPTITAKLTGWTLTNTNLSSFDVRKVPATFTWNLASFSTAAGTDKYRFVGNTAVDAPYGTALSGYRTYWALDPNYNTDATLYQAKTSDLVADYGTDNPLYCFENTFDVAHQTVPNTTLALVEAEIKVDGSAQNLYTVGENKKTLYTLGDVEKLVSSRLFSIPDFVTYFDTYHAASVTELTGSDVTITLSATTAGIVTITGVTIAADKLITGAPALPSTVISALQQATIMGQIQQYVGGTSYYLVRIKHFGDELTPWNKSSNPEYLTAPKESGINDIYPNDARRDANYLGRYGVVRNNWYDISLDAIVGMGSPTIPTIPAHPDDELEDLYIKARINILSWAKRPQSASLK